MKKKDIILIVTILLLAIIAFGVKAIFSEKGAKVTINIDGKEYGTYLLKENQTIDVDGHNTVVIKNEKVYMQDANCPDKLCIKQGEVTSNGEKIVCLPNKTVVEIKSEKQSENDVLVK